MRSQLRLRVLLPLAVLGLLGVGFGAFAFSGTPGEEETVTPAPRLAAKKTPPAAQPAKATVKKSAKKKRPPTPLERALRDHEVVVVLLYTPEADVDELTTREARAGAQAARAGFLAVDVSKEAQVGALAKQHDLRKAPGILVVARGAKVATRFDGYVDRETVAQAADNAVA